MPPKRVGKRVGLGRASKRLRHTGNREARSDLQLAVALSLSLQDTENVGGHMTNVHPSSGAAHSFAAKRMSVAGEQTAAEGHIATSSAANNHTSPTTDAASATDSTSADSTKATQVALSNLVSTEPKKLGAADCVGETETRRRRKRTRSSSKGRWELPPGWKCVKRRYNTTGREYVACYLSPDGKRFRSLVEIQRHLGVIESSDATVAGDVRSEELLPQFGTFDNRKQESPVSGPLKLGALAPRDTTLELSKLDEKLESGKSRLLLQHRKDMERLLGRLCRADGYGHFLYPVSEEQDPQYHKEIASPMDLGTMGSKLKQGDYTHSAEASVSSCPMNWGAFHSDLELLCNNAMSYNPLENIPGNVHREAVRLLRLGQEAISRLRERHEREAAALLAEWELDRLQVENREPAVQGEWRKMPYATRAYQQITSHMPAVSLTQFERDLVLCGLKTTVNGLSPDQEARAGSDPAMRWLARHEDGSCSLHSPSGWRIGADLKIADVWGIDCHTRKSITTAILDRAKHESVKSPFKTTDKSMAQHFIDTQLLPSINSRPVDVAYDMREALRALLTSSSVDTGAAAGADDFVTFASSAVLDAIDRWGSHNFRIHPKGKGVIVCVREGIAAGEFLTEYLGEVYSASAWSERQNILDKLQDLCCGPEAKVLPDFWNMQLETHSTDPNGRSIFTIDPSHCANYASRLSHSCTPNCQTTCVAVDGRYTIALHTIRHVQAGEELTIDYNAVTPSSQEFQLATCLCGTAGCRGSFLYLTQLDAFDEVLKSANSSLHKLANLVIACQSDDSFECLRSKASSLSYNAINRRTQKRRQQDKMAENSFVRREMPKRGLSSYIIFTNEHRDAVRMQHPEAGMTGWTRILSEQWKLLSPDQREKYDSAARTAREQAQAKRQSFEEGPLKALRQQQRNRRDMAREDEISYLWNRVWVVKDPSGADEELLAESGIRGLCSQHLPPWCRRYAALTCRFIQHEQRLLTRRLICRGMERGEANSATQGVVDQRRTNLAITMDRVRAALLRSSIMGDVDMLAHSASPLHVLSSSQIADHLWNTENTSIAQRTFRCLKTHYSYEKKRAAARLTELQSLVGSTGDSAAEPCNGVNIANNSAALAEELYELETLVRIDKLVNTWAWSEDHAREALRCLAAEVALLKNTPTACSTAVSDILLLHADTHTFFTFHKYRESSCRTHDVDVADVPGSFRGAISGLDPSPAIPACNVGKIRMQARQDSLAVHRELLHWHTQDEADYRNPLCELGLTWLPLPESCCGEITTTAPDYKSHVRASLIEHLYEQPHTEWVAGSILGQMFASGTPATDAPVCGSPGLDDIIAGFTQLQQPGPFTMQAIQRLQRHHAQNSRPASSRRDREVDRMVQKLTPLQQVQEEKWVQCENPECLKWRKLPLFVNVNALPSPWVCSMNEWDPQRAACDIPEESWSDEEQEYSYRAEDLDLANVEVGTRVDLFCMQKGGWCEAVVREIRPKENHTTEVRCHYHGWRDRYDEWITLGSTRLAPWRVHTHKKKQAT